MRLILRKETTARDLQLRNLIIQRESADGFQHRYLKKLVQMTGQKGERTFPPPGQFPQTINPRTITPRTVPPPIPLKTQLDNYMHTYMYGCTHAYLYTYMYIHIDACTYVYMHTIHTCIHTYIHAYIYIIHLYTVIYIDIFWHIYIHIYI